MIRETFEFTVEGNTAEEVRTAAIKRLAKLYEFTEDEVEGRADFVIHSRVEIVSQTLDRSVTVERIYGDVEGRITR